MIRMPSLTAVLLLALAGPVAFPSLSMAQEPAPPAEAPPADATANPSPSPADDVVSPGDDTVTAVDDAVTPADIDTTPAPRPVVRVGQDHTVLVGDTAREVVVVMGTATIEGTVLRDVVVVLGTVNVGPEAEIGGALVNVGGRMEIAEGAVVRGDMVVVGSAMSTPVGFGPGGDLVVVAPAWLGERMASVGPWFTRGLLLGRPVVPDLPWIWLLLGATLLCYLFLGLLFDRPLRTCVETLEEKPLSASLTGLLVLVLLGPVSFLLTISVIGLFVLPFAFAALLAGAVFGRAAVVRWIGARLLPEGETEARLPGLRSIVLGSALLVVIYMIPFVGLVIWTLVGVIGLGAVTLAFAEGLRTERPALATPAGSPPPPPPPPPPPFPGSPPGSPAGDPVGQAPVGPTEGAATAAAPAAPQLDQDTFPYAGFGIRLGAFLLDILLVAITARMLGLGDRGGSTVLILLLVYHVALWSWKRTTVGGIICGLRIVRVDGQPLAFGDCLVRGLASIFSLMVAGLGAFWIIWDSERQSWHDKIAGTYVVRVPRNHPL
jgi:uncharacterized RDD family membrane protein YckC